MKKTNPSVDILILHKNGEEILDNCLNALQKTRYPNFKTYVLLNGSTDKSEEILKKYKVKVYKSKENLGFAKGNNYLFKRTGSKYIVLMNNDVEVDKNWLRELIKFSEANNADMVQPKILSLRNKSMFEYAGAAGGYIDKYGFPFCRGRIFNSIEPDKGQYDSNAQIFWSCGSCMMIRRDFLKKIGLFDEDLFMYAEELDLCWRANLAKGKIYNAFKSKVYHLGGFSIKKEKMSKEKAYLVQRNHLIIFLKNYSNGTLLKLLLPRILLEIGSGIIFPSKIYPILRSFYWIIKNNRKISEKRKKIKKIRKVEDKELKKMIYPRSIAIDHYLSNKQKFSDLKFQWLTKLN